MSASIYKIASSIFTLIVVGKVLFLIFKNLSPLVSKATSIMKRRINKSFEVSEGEKNKIWFADYQRKEKEKRDLSEMSYARKAIIAKDPAFWSQEKERFWIKICHPQIRKVDLRGLSLFDTRQRILAEEEFNQDDGEDRSSA